MMKAFIVTALAGLALSTSVSAPAAASDTTPPQHLQPGLPLGEHKVVGMYMNEGTANEEEIQAGIDTTVDQTRIDCPKTSCTLWLTAMQQVEDGNPQGEWRILTVVDDTDVDNGPWQGLEPAQASYLTGNWQGKYVVTQGVHTVTFTIYAQDNLLLDTWSDSATITTP